MQFKLPDLKTCPASVRNGILLLWGGWILHFYFYVSFYLKYFTNISSRELYLQLAVGIGICYFVGIIKKWARMLGLSFNLGIMVIHAAASLQAFMRHNTALALITGATAALFAGSTYFLLKKESSRYFAEQNPSPQATEASER